MTTWISRLEGGSGTGPAVAVKDAIDVAGSVTTAGCAAVADQAEPATTDSLCVAALRAAGARIAGKTNLHELAFGNSGVNPWYGTPVNPLDPTRVPGGSSSGSAVAVAIGEADVALGTDTAGSIRTPAACCGVVGLKTTYGRVPLDGVWPLAPSLDTVGPMARDVAGVVAGMALLEPGFRPASTPASRVGRLRVGDTDPVVDGAIDALLAAAAVDVVEVDLPGWEAAAGAGVTVLYGEAWRSNQPIYERDPDRIGESVRIRLEEGRCIDDDALAAARRHAVPWRAEVDALLRRVDVVVLPILSSVAPRLDDPPFDSRTRNVPVNLSGHPALALTAPTGGQLPAGLQVIGPHGGEELLCATGLALGA